MPQCFCYLGGRVCSHALFEAGSRPDSQAFPELGLNLGFVCAGVHPVLFATRNWARVLASAVSRVPTDLLQSLNPVQSKTTHL